MSDIIAALLAGEMSGGSNNGFQVELDYEYDTYNPPSVGQTALLLNNGKVASYGSLNLFGSYPPKTVVTTGTNVSHYKPRRQQLTNGKWLHYYNDSAGNSYFSIASEVNGEMQFTTPVTVPVAGTSSDHIYDVLVNETTTNKFMAIIVSFPTKAYNISLVTVDCTSGTSVVLGTKQTIYSTSSTSETYYNNNGISLAKVASGQYMLGIHYYMAPSGTYAGYVLRFNTDASGTVTAGTPVALAGNCQAVCVVGLDATTVGVVMNYSTTNWYYYRGTLSGTGNLTVTLNGPTSSSNGWAVREMVKTGANTALLKCDQGTSGVAWYNINFTSGAMSTGYVASMWGTNGGYQDIVLGTDGSGTQYRATCAISSGTVGLKLYSISSTGTLTQSNVATDPSTAAINLASSQYTGYMGRLFIDNSTNKIWYLGLHNQNPYNAKLFCVQWNPVTLTYSAIKTGTSPTMHINKEIYYTQIQNSYIYQLSNGDISLVYAATLDGTNYLIRQAVVNYTDHLTGTSQLTIGVVQQSGKICLKGIIDGVSGTPGLNNTTTIFNSSGAVVSCRFLTANSALLKDYLFT